MSYFVALDGFNVRDDLRAAAGMLRALANAAKPNLDHGQPDPAVIDQAVREARVMAQELDALAKVLHD